MHPLSFPPFRLDLASERLWREAEVLPLSPKAFLLLRYLAEHPERLIGQEELRKAVWRHSHLSDGLLRGYIRELRRVLGDDPKAPRFIETASGRGYRFIAPVTVPGPIGSGGPAPPGFVGRQEELARLHGVLECALRGERQMVFVTGEPGIGKTALLDAFLAQVAGAEDLRIGRGQCIEHYGAAEPYLSLLEALGGLARRAEGPALISLLRRQAPTWLVQIPAFLEEAERDLPIRRGHGATPERMARELSTALEALCAESPLILWLDDLHWGDPSTVDALAMLARRREPARLLVVGTYRPAEVIASAHPLRALVRELEAHAQCRGLPLGYLTTPEVTRYLAVRFAPPDSQATRLDEWGRFLHRHTDGNPLFMVAMVDDLLRRGVIGETSWPAPPEGRAGGLPESLRQLVDDQLQGLSVEERRLLEAAAVAGMEFSPGWVAAALDTDVLEVEGRCEALARRHLFLDSDPGPAGPDRRLADRYRFRHALYPQIVYEGLPAARRRQLHRRVGESKETAFGSRGAEIAAELAVHFEQAGDAPRAVRYLGQAAQKALGRSAAREAADLLARALDRLQTLPETPERARQELALQASLGVALLMSRGYTAPEVKHAFDRAHALCGQAGDSPQLFPALFGLFRFELLRGELRTARSIAERLLRLAQARPDPLLVPAAQAASGAALFHLGEPMAARAHVEQGLRAYTIATGRKPCCFSSGKTRGSCACAMPPSRCRCSVIRIRRSRAAGKPGSWPKRCPTRLAWWERSAPVPLSIDCAGTPEQRKHRRRPPSPWSASMRYRFMASWRPSRGAGRSPSRDRPKRGSQRCATSWASCRPSACIARGRDTSCCWPRRTGGRVRRTRGSVCSKRRSPPPSATGSTGTTPSSIDSKGSSCSKSRDRESRAPNRRRRPRGLFFGPSTSRGARGRGSSSCARR
jgi:DNA-binding winged helix-turn-helix (wHTH) protein